MSGEWRHREGWRKSHWFRDDSIVSVCGNAECKAEDPMTAPHPETSCSRCLAIYRGELLAHAESADPEWQLARYDDLATRVGNSLMREVTLIPKNTPGNIEMAERIKKLAVELLGGP